MSDLEKEPVSNANPNAELNAQATATPEYTAESTAAANTAAQPACDTATLAPEAVPAADAADAADASDAAEAAPAADTSAATEAAYESVPEAPAGGAAIFNANGDPNSADQNVQHVTNQDVDAGAIDPVEIDDVDLDGDERADFEAQIADLQGQITHLQQTAADDRDKMLRAVAECENLRKRTAQEVDRERKYALEKFVRSLLPIYDALEKALEFSDRNNEATKATLEGVENTLSLMLKEFSSFGVELVDPTKQAFDPNFHQAIAQVPSNDVPNGHVLNTMQKGFTLNGRCVRPALVVVAKAKPVETPAAAPAADAAAAPADAAPEADAAPAPSAAPAPEAGTTEDKPSENQAQ